MKWNPLTRRHFLQGLGASMALPLLPSLLPEAAAQALPSPKRFIALGFENGAHLNYWYPTSVDPMTMPFTSTSDYGFRSSQLSALSGNISEVFRDSYTAELGSQFNLGFAGGIRNDMTLIRGIDGLMPSIGHRAGFMLGGNADNIPEETKRGPTIDQVMANSSKFYNGRTPARRSLLCRAEYGAELSYRYDAVTGTMQPGGSIYEPSEIFDRLFVRTDTTQAGPRRSKKIVDLVIEDYRRLKTGAKISKDDLNQLENHMTQLSEMQASFQAASCSGGARPPSTFTFADLSERIKRHMDLIAIAIKCGITQVGVLGMNESVDHNVYNFLGFTNTYHEYTHMGHDHLMCKKLVQFFCAHIPYLYNQLTATEGSTGQRYIDNTLIYFGSHMARDHHQADMPVLLVGGNSMINTGRYVDYRFRDYVSGEGYRPGRNYSQLLVSLLGATGLGAADYRYPGVTGGWGTDRLLASDSYSTGIVNAGGNANFRTSRTLTLPGLLKA